MNHSIVPPVSKPDPAGDRGDRCPVRAGYWNGSVLQGVRQGSDGSRYPFDVSEAPDSVSGAEDDGVGFPHRLSRNLR